MLPVLIYYNRLFFKILSSLSENWNYLKLFESKKISFKARVEILKTVYFINILKLIDEYNTVEHWQTKQNNINLQICT